MYQKLFSKKIAKRLLTYGAIGFIVSIAAPMLVLPSVYDKAETSGLASACTTSCVDLTWQKALINIAAFIFYSSIATVLAGTIMTFTIDAKTKKEKQAAPLSDNEPRQRNITHLLVRITADVAAFFVSTFIVVAIIAGGITKGTSKNMTQQSHLFAYVIIFAYPLVGGLSAYFTDRYIKKRLH